MRGSLPFSINRKRKLTTSFALTMISSVVLFMACDERLPRALTVLDYLTEAIPETSSELVSLEVIPLFILLLSHENIWREAFIAICRLATTLCKNASSSEFRYLANKADFKSIVTRIPVYMYVCNRLPFLQTKLTLS